MLWFITNDPTYRMASNSYDPTIILQTAIANGLSYDTYYQEIYAADLLNPQLQPTLKTMLQQFEKQ